MDVETMRWLARLARGRIAMPAGGRRRRPLRLSGAALLLALSVSVAGCDGRVSAPGAGGAFGGDARVVTLARATVDQPLPADAAWIAWRITLDPGERIVHRHAVSTVYADEGSHTLTVGGRKHRLRPQEGAIVQARQWHVHKAGDAGAVFWDVLLATHGTRVAGAKAAERVFETKTLQGVPPRPSLAFLAVTLLPDGGRTTVHSHPGPETILVTDGPFEYQTALERLTTVDDGAVKSIPPGTPVQKRNPGSRPARFLSWFLVDPAKPFAPLATFEETP